MVRVCCKPVQSAWPSPARCSDTCTIRQDRGQRSYSDERRHHQLSGHFHRPQKTKNIIYPGSLIPLNFSETDYKHGFYLLDSETQELEWFNSSGNIFKKIIYDNNNILPLRSEIDGKVVKVIATDIKNQLHFEQWKNELEKMNPIEVKVNALNIDYPTNDLSEENTIEDFEFVNILKEMCYNINKDINKDKLFELAERIYNESQEEKLK